uniref:Uncharacterized protein n=1 Tax=Arundo donax TaxID=35708 RepID=A0A0A9GZN4_ARUDO
MSLTFFCFFTVQIGSLSTSGLETV